MKGTVLRVLGVGPCTECDRTRLQAGIAYSIEAARMDDGREPVFDYIESLKQQTMKGSPGKRAAAAQRIATIVDVLEVFARTGQLKPGREIKPLDDIHEIKAGDIRLPCYYQARHPIVTAVRLTSGFTKGWSGRHPQSLVRFAHKVYREDDAR